MPKVNSYQFLGLPRNASPDEVERHCGALLELLRSNKVPAKLRQWAEAQEAVVQDVYESLESAGADMGRTEEVTIGATFHNKRSFMQVLSRPWVLAPAGVVLGIAILGGMWWTDVIPGREKTPAADTTTNPQDTFDPQAFIESHQGQIATWTQAVTDDPTNTEALFNLGEVYIVGEQWEKGVSWFQKLLEVDPHGTYAQSARDEIGWAYMNLYKLDEAQAMYTEALTYDSSDAQAHYSLAWILAFMLTPPDIQGAISHYNEVLKLAPGTDLSDAATQDLAQLQAMGTTTN